MRKIATRAIDRHGNIPTGMTLVTTRVQVIVGHAHPTKGRMDTTRHVMEGIHMTVIGEANVMIMCEVADRENAFVVQVRDAIQLRLPVLQEPRLNGIRGITAETIGIRTETHVDVTIQRSTKTDDIITIIVMQRVRGLSTWTLHQFPPVQMDRITETSTADMHKIETRRMDLGRKLL